MVMSRRPLFALAAVLLLFASTTAATRAARDQGDQSILEPSGDQTAEQQLQGDHAEDDVQERENMDDEAQQLLKMTNADPPTEAELMEGAVESMKSDVADLEREQDGTGADVATEEDDALAYANAGGDATKEGDAAKGAGEDKDAEGDDQSDAEGGDKSDAEDVNETQTVETTTDGVTTVDDAELANTGDSEKNDETTTVDTSGKVELSTVDASANVSIKAVGIQPYMASIEAEFVKDIKESDAWYQDDQDRRQGIIDGVQAEIDNITETELAKARTQLEDARNALSELIVNKKNIEKDQVSTEKRAGAAVDNYNSADARWNRTITGLASQAEAARDSQSSINKILQALQGPRPDASIASILALRQASNSDTVEDIMAKAAQGTRDLAGGDRARLRELIEELKTQLNQHIEKLEVDRQEAIDSRAAHLKKIEERVKLVMADFEVYKQLALTNAEKVGEAKATVEKREIELQPVQKKIQLLQNQLEDEKADKFMETEIYERQKKNRDDRLKMVQQVQNVIAEKIKEGNKEILVRLGEIELNEKEDNLTAPTNGTFDGAAKDENATEDVTIPLSDEDLSADNCGTWKFDEEDGSPFVTDESPRGQDGKLHNHDLIRHPGHDNGKSLLFNGMGTYIDMGRLGGDETSFGSSLKSFTISFWIKTIDARSASSSVIKVIEEGEGQVVAIEPNRRVGQEFNGRYPSGQVAGTDMGVQSGTTAVYLRDRSGNILAGHVEAPYFDNKWHHIQWTVKDASKNQMSFYVDGVFFPWVAWIHQSPSNFAPFSSNVYVGAGNNRGTPQGFFDGSLDDLRLFCSAQEPIYGKDCCKVCQEGKACGDVCIDADDVCDKENGCACNAREIAKQHPATVPQPDLPLFQNSTTSPKPGQA